MGYNERVRWLGLVVLLAACGQDESYFHAPDPGNLVKDPYDFSAQKYPRDLSGVVVPDDGGSDDMTINNTVDAAGHDLLILDNVDMTQR